ncbi:MAG: hypothetical protein RLZZ324_1178 [Candidatus Parcubacteria bacterium]|jgi:hypothetical protein
MLGGSARNRAVHLTAIAIAGVLLSVGLFARPGAADATIKTPADKYVRTANYFLKAGSDITSADYPKLAKYDLLVFPAEAQVYNAGMFAELRRLNPNIIILAYVPTKSWNDTYWNDALHQKLKSGIHDDWWLLSAEGTPVSVWPGTRVISGESGWNDYLPHFVHDEIMSTGDWDGIFYDEFSSNASWMNGGDIDVHREGKRTDPVLIDVGWKRGMINLLRTTRSLLGPDAVIVTNGDSTNDLQPFVNGRMFESFPTPWEAGGTWQGVMGNYLRLQSLVGSTPVFIINSNTGNSGFDSDYRKVRFGLASTLMGDGFFSFDFGESDHGQLWPYDEQNVVLGAPLAGSVNLSAPSDKRVRVGLWRRDFTGGTALVNSTGAPVTVQLGQEMEKIRGTQDAAVNDGAVVTTVTVPPSDGLLLQRRVEKIEGSAYPNGSFVRLFDARGQQTRNGFFAYQAPFDGGAVVDVRDIDGDGKKETVVASKGVVSIYDAGGALRTSFMPYGPAYKGAINYALGDMDGDGKQEIVTGTGPGAGAQIRVYESDGRAVGPGFFAYDKNFRGGVSVAVGDVYGTGRPVIVAGAGPGGGPHVRLFTKGGRVLNPGFFAYDPAFRGGVSVAVGDLDGDGKAEIVTGAGPGGGPHVRIFNAAGRARDKGFFAADPAARGGVVVSVTDVDGNGRAEIATLTSDVFQFSTLK